MSKNVRQQLQSNASTPKNIKKQLKKPKSLKATALAKDSQSEKVPAQVKPAPIDVEKAQREILFEPNPGPQTDFLASTEQEVLYGGSAGGGKSYAMVADPVRYLNNPNGRILYMLKSFMLKQYDIVRREVVQEWNKADTLAQKAEAAKKGATLFGYLAVGNAGTGMIKDMALRREVDVDQIPDRSVWALLGIYGANKYTSERYLSQGDFVGATVNLPLRH